MIRSILSIVGAVVMTAVGVVVSGCSTELVGDPYFARTKSNANVYAIAEQTKVMKIAVMPLKASTELIGSSVSDLVVTELLRMRKYSLVERSQMSRVLSETELAMAGLSESKAVEVAKLMGAEAVVIGTVDEYGTQAKGGDTYAVVGLSIRLIDCSNGRIIWSVDLAEVADDEDTPLARHARDVVHKLVSGLYQNLVGQEMNLPPPPPAGLTVSEMGLREAEVSWNRPTFRAKCQIERAVSEEGPFAKIAEVAASDGSYRDQSGLKDGSMYYYRARFVNKLGAVGDPSDPVETMTAPPPEPPRGVRICAPSSRCVELRWSAPKSEGITGYRVERAAEGSESWKSVGTPTASLFKDGGIKGCDLNDSTKYRYRIYAVNRVGAVGEACAPVTVETLPPPREVEGFFAASREIRCVPLRWSQSAEQDVAGYEIEVAEGKGDFKPLTRVEGKTVVEFLHGDDDPGDLPDENAYRYRIRAFNDVGSVSEWSEAEAVTKPAPKTPSGVTVTSDLAGRIAVKWEKNPEPDIAEYRVEAKGAGGFFWHKVNVVNLTAEETGLKPGECVNYRVMAVGPKNHQSEWSPAIAGKSRPLPPPPTGLSVASTENGYKVTFSPAREGMTGYRIYRKKFIGSELIAENKEPVFMLSLSDVGEKGIDVVVTEIDECGLESEHSGKLTVNK